MASKAEADWRAFRRYDHKGYTVLESPGRIVFTYRDVSLTGLGIVFAMLAVTAIPMIIAIFGTGYFLNYYTPITVREHPVWNGVLAMTAPILAYATTVMMLVSFQSALIIEPGHVIWERRTRRFQKRGRKELRFLLSIIGYLVLLAIVLATGFFLGAFTLFGWVTATGWMIGDRQGGILIGNAVIAAAVTLAVLTLYGFVVVKLYRRWRPARRPAVEYPEDDAPARKAIVIPVEEIRIIEVRQGESLNMPELKAQHFNVVFWHGPVPIYTVSASRDDVALTLKEGIVAAIGVLNPRLGNTGDARRPGWE